MLWSTRYIIIGEALVGRGSVTYIHMFFELSFKLFNGLKSSLPHNTISVWIYPKACKNFVYYTVLFSISSICFFILIELLVQYTHFLFWKVVSRYLGKNSTSRKTWLENSALILSFRKLFCELKSFLWKETKSFHLFKIILKKQSCYFE
jgi:hypothetical protein